MPVARKVCVRVAELIIACAVRRVWRLAAPLQLAATAASLCSL